MHAEYTYTSTYFITDNFTNASIVLKTQTQNQFGVYSAHKPTHTEH